MHVVEDETSGTPIDRGPEGEGMPSTRAIIKKERKHSTHRGQTPNTIKNSLHISICTSEYRGGIHTKCAAGKSEMTQERERKKNEEGGGGNTSSHKNVVISEREVKTFLSLGKTEMAPGLCPRRGYHIGGNKRVKEGEGNPDCAPKRVGATEGDLELPQKADLH